VKLWGVQAEGQPDFVKRNLKGH